MPKIIPYEMSKFYETKCGLPTTVGAKIYHKISTSCNYIMISKDMGQNENIGNGSIMKNTDILRLSKPTRNL